MTISNFAYKKRNIAYIYSRIVPTFVVHLSQKNNQNNQNNP